MADDKQKLLDVVTTTKLNDEDFFFVGQTNGVKKIRKENVDFPTDDTLTKEGYPADAKAVGSAIEDLQGVALSTGQPIGVSTKLKMIDTTKNYLYLGEENGFEYGYIYTYVNGAWTKTRLYGKGRDGVDGYTVILTNESYIFPGTVETAQDDEVTTEVMVYKGDEVITPTSILVGDLPTGLTAFVHGPLITFTSTTDLVKSNGAIPITIVADRKIFTKYFCYAIAFIGTEHIDFDFDGLNDTLGTLSHNVEGIEQNLANNYYNKSYFDIDNGDFTLGIERKYKDEIASQLGEYPTTGDTRALIKASADELSSTISTTYSTKNAVNDLANRVNRAVKGVRIEYISVRKGITPEDDDPGWSTAAPQWKDTCDIWQRVVTETATDVYYSNITNISGRDGSAITLDAQVVEYAVSASGTEPPDENADWSLSVPNVPVGSFLWTRTTVVYSDGQYTEAYTVSYRGGDGQIGVSISSIEERYAISNSTIAPADNVFQTSPIPVMSSVNPYLWNYEIISYSDGSTSSTNKKIIGHYGRDGTQGVPGLNGYVHTAWANSADGSTGFSTSVSENKLYLGTYTDNLAPDSNNPSDYSWSLIKGDDGVGITSIVNYYLKTNRQTGVTTAVNEGWSDDPSTQVVDANNPYLWNYEVITYSNGVSSASDPCIIGNYSESGTSISIVSSSVEYQKSESGTVRPTTWLNSLPSLSQGEFLWSKTHVVYSDGTETIAYSVSRFGIDGTPGEDAYTVVLSNENHTFVGTTTHALSGGTTSAVSVYQGSTPVTVTHITVGTKPTGLNSEVNGSTVTFTATESLTTPHGTIPITIEIAGGLTFTKYFSYSIAFAGADAPLISVTADTNVILIDKTGTYTPSTNFSVVGTASNTTITGIQYSVNNGAYSSTLPTGVSVSGTTVTIAPQTSTFNTLSIKMSDGSISDTTTIMRVREGRGIANVVEYYAVNNDSSQAPTSNTFSTTIPTMTASNPYLWNYERITYSDGSTPIETTPCIIGRYGSDGASISNVINYYLATNASSNVTRATTGWTTTIQEVSSTHKYLWNYEEVQYTNNKASTYTDPCIIGNYADDGVSIQSIVEHYAISDSSSTAPADNQFVESPVPTMTEDYPYLWNYETINYTRGNPTTTAKKVIGRFGADGAQGRSITGVVNYYLASNLATGVTTATAGWSTDVSTQSTSASSPYLWNYEVVNYSSGNPTVTTPCIIGNYAADGQEGISISSVTEYYAVSNSTTPPADNDFSTTIQTMTSENPYLWNYEVITYSRDKNPTTTSKQIIGRYGVDGPRGVSVSNVINYYLASASKVGITTSDPNWSESIPTTDASHPYLWNYEEVVFSDNNTRISTSPCVIGNYAADGEDGVDAISCILTNESHVFAGSATAALQASTTTGIIAYKGTQELTIDDVTWSAANVPTGMTLSKSNDKKTITISVTTAMTTSSGTIPISISADGKIIVKHFSYSISFKGTNAPSISVVPETNAIIIDKNNNYTPNASFTVTGFAFNTTITSYQYKVDNGNYTTTAPTGVTRSGNTVTINPTTSTFNTLSIRMGDSTINDTTTIIRVREGVDGANGDDGVSVRSITEYYVATNSTTAPADNEFSTTIQQISSTNQYLWNYEVITYSNGNTVPSAKRIIGRYGQDGSSVTVSSTEYQAGTSATTAPTGDWLTSIPSVTEGQYLWTKVTYSDNSTAYSVAKQGVSGTSVTVSNIEYAYQLSTSGTTVPTGEWFSAPQAPTATQYAWTRTTTTYSDGTVATTYTVGGKTGTSITISSKSVTYQASTSGTTTPTGEWSNSVPSVDKGKFLWTKTYVKYSDNNETTSYSVAYRGTDGTSVSISQESVTYQTSNSGTTTPTGAWQNSVPSVAQGQFLWTKTYVKYSDNTETTSYSVSRYGSDGVSITDVTNYYLASALASGVTTSTAGWTTEIQTTDSSKPYLWNYEVVTYSSGSPTTTDPCIIGNYASDGADAISCVLTNESHIFAGDDSHALASSTTTDILLFRGATPITPQQVTYTNSTQGLTVLVSNDNKTIRFTASTSLTASSGNVPITIVVDNNTTITKTFSWSVSFRGADASIITLTSPTQVIKVAENNNKTPNSPFTVTGAATNTTIASWTFGVNGGNFDQSPPTGVTVNTTTNTVTITPATVTFKTLSIKAANSTGQTFDIFTIVQVQDGATGTPGTGIREVIALYKKTTSKTESKPTEDTENQWSTTQPEWSLGYYIHTCSKIIYTDDNVSYTTPSCDSSWEAIYGLNVGGSNLLYWSEKLHDSKETNPTYVPYLNMTITDGVANSNPNSVTKNCYFGSWPEAISYADVNNQELTYSIFCKTTDSWGSYNANTNCIMLTVRLVDDEGVQKLSKDLFFENGVKTKTTTPNYTPKSYWTQANVTFFVEDGLFDTGSYNGDKSELYFEIITYNYSTHDLSLKLPKLEIGNIATAWTPNTQDLIGYTNNKLLNYSTTADIINSIRNSSEGIGGAIQGKITNATTYLDDQNNIVNVAQLGSKQTILEANLAGYATTVSNITTDLTNEINQRKATYGTSATDAEIATKVVACSNFALYPGATISVKFSNENTNATPALDVNNTGAKTIKTFKGSALAESEYQWEAGSVLDFVYDGIDWIFVDNGMTARVTSAESSITQNERNIALKVSESDVTGNYLVGKINLSSTSAQIEAERVNIAGAAIFTSGRLSETSLNNAYDASGSATTAYNNAIAEIPTNISELTNDSGYQTSSQVNSSISSATSNMLTAVTTKDQYYLSTSSSSVTGGDWQDTVPTWSANRYIWTRVATTKTTAGNNSTTTHSIAVYDSALTSALSIASSASSTASAAQTTANSAASTVVTTKQYYLSTSTSSATGGSWETSVPTWSSGKYIWVRFEIVKTPISGTATTTYSPSSAGTYDSALTTALSTANAASNAINNLEVGGRNLARHTSSEWRSQAIVDGENKQLYLFPSGADERDDYSTDLTGYGFKAGDVIQLSFDIRFSDDFTASGNGTKHAYIQGNKNWLGGSWASLNITGGNRGTAIEEIISSASKEGHVSTYFNITADMLDGTYTGYLYMAIRFDYYIGTVYVKNVMLEKSDKPSIWSLAPEDITTEEQRIYYRSSSSTAPNGNGLPIAWVTENGNKYNVDATTSNGWSRKITSMANGSTKYPYLWTCIQRRTVNGDISYTDILLDDSTTIIDGGHIITGSVTANQLSTDAIKSNDYTAGTSGSPYSSAGTFLDLSNGNIYTPNFGVNNGDAYFKGEVIGGNKTSYNSNDSGYYLGSDGRFGLGDGNGYIQYNGTNLNIKGNLTLTSGQSVENKISEEVSNIKIGGRNLLLETSKEVSWTVSLNSSNYGVKDCYMTVIPVPTLFEENDLVTVSFDWESTATSGNFHLECGKVTPYVWGTVVSASGTRSSTSNYVDITSTNQLGHVVITFRVTSAVVAAAETLQWMRIRVDGVGTSGTTFTISNAKAERGNKATDWSPASEDVNAIVELNSNNMLLDWNAPSIVAVNSSYARYFSDSSNTTITPSIVEISNPPENGILYGFQAVNDGTNTATKNRALVFYDAENGIPITAGQTYTVTWWARKIAEEDDGETIISYCNHLNGEGSTTNTHSNEYILTTDWQLCTEKIVAPTLNINYNRLWFYASFPSEVSGTVQLCGFKMVAGYSVSEKDYKEYTDAEIDVIQASLTEKSDELNRLTRSYDAYVEGNDGKVGDLIEDLANVTEAFNTEKAWRENYMRYDSESGILQLGAKVDDKLESSLDLTSSRLEFKLYDSNGEALTDNSYMTAQMLYNKNIQTDNALIIGTASVGRFAFVNLGQGLAFGLASDLVSSNVLDDEARKT